MVTSQTFCSLCKKSPSVLKTHGNKVYLVCADPVCGYHNYQAELSAKYVRLHSAHKKDVLFSLFNAETEIERVPVI